MLNQVIMVGRLSKEVEVKELEDNKKQAVISLAIPRSYKNAEGIYETDFVDCILYDNIAQNTKEYCSKGDIIGVKGRIQSRIVENDDKKENKMEIVAEKITFLSSKKED